MQHTKKLSYNTVCGDLSLSKNSIREITMLQYFDHPNIIKFHKITDTEIVMEEGGENLTSFYNNNVITFDHVVAIICQILQALEHIHERKVLHRDIKPDNILVSYDADIVCKICDFDLSIFMSNEYESVVYTPWYSAPETFNCHYSDKSDMWSVGCIIYELCHHIPLFIDLTDSSVTSILNNIIKKLGPPPDDIVSRYLHPRININSNNTSTGMITNASSHLDIMTHTILDDLMLTMLSYDPNERPSASEALSHPIFASFDLHKPIYRQLNYIVNDYEIINRSLDGILRIIASNLMTHLIIHENMTNDHVYQWVIVCLISMIGDKQYNFHEDFIADSFSYIDFGKAIMYILYSINFDIMGIVTNDQDSTIKKFLHTLSA